MLDITKDIRCLTNFRRKSGKFLKEMKKSKRPMVLTVNGKAEAVVQDAESYQRLLDSVSRADVYEAIRQGVDDIVHERTARPARRSTNCVGAMAYLVELTLRAERDLEYLYQRISRDDSEEASRWFNGREEAIYGLERLPRRCPVAPESKGAKRRLRHLLYGAKRDVYRVIYEIDESRKVVRVLTIRHAAMDEFISGA